MRPLRGLQPQYKYNNNQLIDDVGSPDSKAAEAIGGIVNGKADQPKAGARSDQAPTRIYIAHGKFPRAMDRRTIHGVFIPCVHRRFYGWRVGCGHHAMEQYDIAPSRHRAPRDRRIDRPAYKGGQGKGAGGQESPLLAPLFFCLFSGNCSTEATRAAVISLTPISNMNININNK